MSNNNAGSNDNDVYVPSQGRERVVEGYSKKDRREVHRHTGFVQDPKTRRALSIISQWYDPHECEEPGEMPATYMDLEVVQDILQTEGTETYQQAVETGDIPTIRHFTGDTQERAKLSPYRGIKQLRDLLNRNAAFFYIGGPPGFGKTALAGLMIEVWKEDVEPTGVIGSNLRYFREAEWTGTYTTLVEWLEQDGKDAALAGESTPKALLIDEASSELHGEGEAGHMTRKYLGPLILRIRQWIGNGGIVIWIGHYENSIHPLFRELAFYVEKESKKKATVYKKLGGPKIEELDGIPLPGLNINYNEKPSFTFDVGGDDGSDGSSEEAVVARDVAVYTAIRAKQQGLSDREAAKFVPYGKSWVNNRWDEYTNDGEHEDVMDTIEAEIK